MELPVESLVEGRCNGMGIGENGQVESGRIVFVVEGLDVVVRIGPETEPLVEVQTSCRQFIGDLFDFEDDGFVGR